MFRWKTDHHAEKQTEILRQTAEAQGLVVSPYRKNTLGDWLYKRRAKKAAPETAAPPPPTQVAPAPGWYLSPSQPGMRQWWDGTQWTPAVTK